MTRLLRLTAGFLVAATLAVVGCTQGVGDRCQVQSDCDSNLICVLPAGATPQSGGTCQNPASETGADMATSDLAATVPGGDLATAHDMGNVLTD